MPEDCHINIEFDNLIERHRKLIEFLCQRGSYGQEVYFRDYLQECYVVLLHHFAEHKSTMSELHERAWVYWKCREAITRFQRRLNRFPELFPDDLLPNSFQSSREVSRLTVDDCAACLDGIEREGFLLMVEGLPDKEVERRLHLSHQALLRLRHNIKKKLKKHLEQ